MKGNMFLLLFSSKQELWKLWNQFGLVKTCAMVEKSWNTDSNAFISGSVLPPFLFPPFCFFKENDNNNNNIAIFQNLSCLTMSWNQYPIYPLLSSFEMCWIQISLQCGGLEVLKKSSLTWSHGAELNCLEFMVIGRFLFFAACRKKSEQWLNYIIIFQGILFSPARELLSD